ncbi:MAG: aspartate aminotransferase family protein [Oceanicoccus sp.]|uniref:aspartate aminotransferase family protein n=1 Tax=Oceanicoccus sp. TaxID=2691044 RepID=UPI002626D21E|nr:aspartate aminotransferase family protein [Oceanicoccus sp.]MCP3908440.1 aspartate aminotransferase family protein [Oceanicoccus sp.]MDG1772612.1 aspartate aminotransferase family protein [Oceanicoccus sp.]
MNTYGRLPVSFSHGKNVYLYDQEGHEYLDAISGIGVNALGHAHPAVTEAIKSQADLLIHTSNLYGIERQQKLAESLCAISGMESVFFSNSGAEANEAAIKIARLYGHNNGIDLPQIVVMDNAFHGRTMATLTASGNRKIQAGFEPLLGGFLRAPHGDIEALKNIAQNNRNVVAVLVEPIQGEGGINVLPENFMPQLRALCDQQQWLMMLDEVQSGNGRTGEYFAYQHHDLLPDVVTTAKGLGNGLPIGACLAQGKAAETLGPGNHGSTYGGNPLVCAAAQAVVDTIAEQKLCDNAKQLGNWLIRGFREQLGDKAIIKDIRGQGLMIGIELTQPCGELVNQAREKGLLINVTAGNVIRLLPPLIINQAQAEILLASIVDIVNSFAESH